MTGTVAELLENINQLSTMMVQIQKTLAKMETRLANLVNNRCAGNHRVDGENIRNQRDPYAVNVYRDLGIKLVISKYDGKLKPDKFMDWLVCVCVCVNNIFAHKPMTDGHKVTLVEPRFGNYAAIW